MTELGVFWKLAYLLSCLEHVKGLAKSHISHHVESIVIHPTRSVQGLACVGIQL